MYSVTTGNRFDPLVCDRMAGGVTPSVLQGVFDYDRRCVRENFRTSSTDEKLLMLFDEMGHIKDEQVNCSKGMASMQTFVSNTSHKINRVIQVTNTQSDLLKTLAYKSIDLEARSRRNNLIIRGIAENYDENCFEIVRGLLGRNLGINPATVYITRAHRLGVRSRDRHHVRRPIIVNFRDFGDVERIMSVTNRLRNTPFSIDYDLPKEIQAARKNLWTPYHQAKRDRPRSRVQIVYPAKLVIDGRVVQIHESRLPDLDHVTNMRLPGYPFKTNENPEVANVSNVPAYNTSMPPPIVPSSVSSGPSYDIPPPPIATRYRSNETSANSPVLPPPAPSRSTGCSVNIGPALNTPMILSAGNTGSSGPSLNTTTTPPTAQARPSSVNIDSSGLGNEVPTDTVQNTSKSSEETFLKTLESDSTNPTITRMTAIQQKMADGGTHVSRSIKRKTRRSKSYSPYSIRTRAVKQTASGDISNASKGSGSPRNDISDVITIHSDDITCTDDVANSESPGDVTDSPGSHAPGHVV